MENPDFIIKMISDSSAISTAIWGFTAVVLVGFLTVAGSIWVATHNTNATNKIKQAEFESSHQLKEKEFIASSDLKKLEFMEMKRVNQTQVYWEWLDSLQEFMNDTTSPVTTKQFQKSSMKAIVQGENELAKYLRDYYFAIIRFSQEFNAGLPVTDLDHNEHQRKIINQMRIAQGMKDIGSIYLIVFKPS